MIVLIVSSCNFNVFYKKILSNKFDLLSSSILFLKINFSGAK
jgi:hypothetical protein